MANVALVGYEPPSSSGTSAISSLRFVKFVAIRFGILHEIKVWSSARGNIRVGIYTDSGDLPDVLMAESASTAIVNGWNTISVSDAMIRIGAVYWLVYQTETSIHLRKNDGEPHTCRYRSYTYGTLPNPAGTTTSASINSVGIVGYGEELDINPIPPKVSQFRRRVN